MFLKLLIDNSLIVSKSYPVRNDQFVKSAPYSSAYSVSTSGVSRSGSTEKDTRCVLSTLALSNFSCKIAILLVIGKQTVVQFVKIKSATQYLPCKSSFDSVSPSCVVYSKSGTVDSIFVSTFSPPQAASTKTSDKVKMCMYFFMKNHPLTNVSCLYYHNFMLIISYKRVKTGEYAQCFMTCL